MNIAIEEEDLLFSYEHTSRLLTEVNNEMDYFLLHPEKYDGPHEWAIG